MNDPILITGCSTGIGRAVALALLDRGHTVYATARRVETLADLEAKGARILPLDVTDEKSMTAAVRTIEAEYSAVGTLINNAGFAKYGALENVPLDEARRQLETNVFGLARLTQLVLPAMRKAGRGRIINVSSMGGRLTFPLGAWYHVSKHAVEALSDTLRQEVRGFGIDVVLMEPGAIRTEFGTTLDAEYVRDADGPYAGLEAAGRKYFGDAYKSRWTGTADEAARAFVRAVEARRPKHRYLSTAMGKFSVNLRRLGGSRLWDAIVRSQFAGAAKKLAKAEAKASRA
ncbi:MAG: SDR family NAD(P)-dependent oxidoreductase [Demequinaceae bacterium]|nr:SDR family NAD(P)-dependent oxidoreductase [Demequinaceae bacterium]